MRELAASVAAVESLQAWVEERLAAAQEEGVGLPRAHAG
jgi:hypothetical protein